MNTTRRPNIFMSAAEVSGDIAGAHLTRAIQKIEPQASFFGIGGRQMAATGFRVDVDSRHFGVIGLVETLAIVPKLLDAFKTIRRSINERRPDVAVLIGYEGLHVPLARWFRRRGIPTASFLPPQVWLWGTLSGPIARSYDLILASVPDEESVYRQAGGQVHFVGHYLRDLVSPLDEPARKRLREGFGIPPDSALIALLPGSRRQEIDAFAPELLDVAQRLLQEGRNVRFVLPVADPSYRPMMRSLINQRALAARVHLADSGIDAMAACDLAILASGTAALEAALCGTPMIIVYRLWPGTVAMVRLLQILGVIRYDCIGLPNLLLGRSVVPELHQGRARAPHIAEAAGQLLSDREGCSRMTADLRRISKLLGEPGSLDRAAESILSLASPLKVPENMAQST